MKRLLTTVLCTSLVLCCLFGCGKTDSDEALNVLAIGSYGKDILTYVEPLAKCDGYTVNATYLDLPGSTLRDLASAFAAGSKEFTYYEADDTSFTAQEGVGADEIMSHDWDVVILQQAILFSGFPGTYNSDLSYLTDYIHDKTNAKLYWNMTWAAEDSLSDEALWKYYKYYDTDCTAMHNAIVDCVNTSIVENDDFDGWIPTGAAIWQVREQLGDMTVNGHNLSDGAAQLTAALTTIKTLLPDYDLSKATHEKLRNDDLAAIVAAVDTVCQADFTVQKTDVAAQAISENADVTLAQVAAPMRLHFPDLEVLENGTVIVGAYESICHKPTAGTGNFQEGAGRLLLWSGSDNGATWDYDNPLLIVDQEQIEAWGLVEITNRYEQLKNGNTNYVVMADPRDPNLSSVRADMDGDGEAEEVLLFTFWIKFYTETKTTNKCYLSHSVDGGKSWSAPQELKQSIGNNIIKRGDIASFSDGQILIPYYWGKRVGSLLMEYDVQDGAWFLLRDSEVVNFAPDEGENFNEVSFVAPDPDSDTVYAYCRENGIVLRSDDRGGSWELLANEGGLIHQPGFTILDKDRVYVTWALTARPRPTLGKVFQVDKGWDATKSQLLYFSPDKSAHDMGDPSCALLADGRVLVICYDTTYRSIVGVYVDPTK